MDESFSQEKKENLYKTFGKSLDNLDTDGVEIIPQTMAPFPWHFGGQRFQNIFAAAGHPNCVFKIDFENLVKITKGKIENITE